MRIKTVFMLSVYMIPFVLMLTGVITSVGGILAAWAVMGFGMAYYATFFYGLMTIYWFIAKDFEQLIRYDRKNLLTGQGLSFKSALAQIIFHKTWYALVFIVLPIMVIPVSWGILMAGFLIMHFICGVILAYIFQLAHVIEETSFFKQDETGSVENNWAIHQLSTTANFANTNRVFSWLVC